MSLFVMLSIIVVPVSEVDSKKHVVFQNVCATSESSVGSP